MRHLVAGHGQIGKAIGSILPDYDHADIGIYPPESRYDVLHVCFPYTNDFVEYVKTYAIGYHVEHVIIYSTVPIGTTVQISGAVHSPVEGKHPQLTESIRSTTRWIAGENLAEVEFFANLFEELGLGVRVLEYSSYTEALKLLSTTEFGWNLIFADYKARVANDIGMDFELTKEWNREYNALYDKLGLGDNIKKYVLDPPNGKIGGHCVKENARLLYNQFPDDMVRRIGEME